MAVESNISDLRRLRGDLRRLHCVSVRLNDLEFRHVREWAMGAQRKLGELFREVALGSLPPVVSEINRARWEEHARTLAHLNQLAYALNRGQLLGDVRPVLAQLIAEVHALRAELRGENPAP